MDRLKNRFDIALERIPRNIYEKFPSMMHREINEFFFLILRDIKNRRERFNRNFIGLPGCQNRKKKCRQCSKHMKIQWLRSF